MGEGIVIFYDPFRLGPAVNTLCSRWKIPFPEQTWWSGCPMAKIPLSNKDYILRYVETDVPRERYCGGTDWLYYALIGRKIPYWEFRRRSEKVLQKAEALRVEVWT